jgi:hypothetical protein
VTIDGVWFAKWIYWTFSKLATSSNNNSSWIYTVYNTLQHTTSVLSVLCLLQSSGKVSQCQTFPFLLALKLSPCLSHSNSRLTSSQKLHSHARLNFNAPFHRAALSQNELNLCWVDFFNHNLSVLTCRNQHYFILPLLEAPLFQRLLSSGRWLHSHSHERLIVLLLAWRSLPSFEFISHNIIICTLCTNLTGEISF